MEWVWQPTPIYCCDIRVCRIIKNQGTFYFIFDLGVIKNEKMYLQLNFIQQQNGKRVCITLSNSKKQKGDQPE